MIKFISLNLRQLMSENQFLWDLKEASVIYFYGGLSFKFIRLFKCKGLKFIS